MKDYLRFVNMFALGCIMNGGIIGVYYAFEIYKLINKLNPSKN